MANVLNSEPRLILDSSIRFSGILLQISMNAEIWSFRCVGVS